VTSLTHNGDIFVNDWLAANKDHDCASLALSHWYRVAGVDLDKQVQALELIINEAKRPLTLIVGGLDIGKWLATADALIKLIQNVAVDDVLIGGLVGVLFLKYLQKMNTGATKLNVEAGEQESEANRRVFQFVQKCESRGTQVHLPKDFEVLDRVKDPLGKQMGVVDVARGVPSNQEVVDIGMDTTNMFNEFIKNSATVVWFSSVGDTRNNFTHSTSAMLDTLVEATRGGAFSAVVGGALSRYTEQVKRLRAPEHLSYISSDTSAWIEYLAGDGLYCWSLLSSEDDLRRPRYTVERDPTGAGVTHEPFTLRGANDLLDGRTMNGHVALSEPQQYDLDREREKRRDELANLFDECDLDGSGAIVLEELRIVLNGKGYTDHFVERFFCHLDLNKDGQIERDEFREALKFLPKKIFLSNEPISDRDMFGVFDDLDTDNSGTLTWHELREGLLLRGVPYSVIKSYFDQLDLNEDSEITKREYAKCIGLQGY
jgi:3-phosphoglycerate kinase/Ca2+-binding EF-hand superfamily protein